MIALFSFSQIGSCEMNNFKSRRTLFVRWNAIALAKKEAWCSIVVSSLHSKWGNVWFFDISLQTFHVFLLAWFQMKNSHLIATNISFSIEYSWWMFLKMSGWFRFQIFSLLACCTKGKCFFYARFHRTDAHENERIWFVHVFNEILFFFLFYWKSVVFAFRGHSHQLFSCVI